MIRDQNSLSLWIQEYLAALIDEPAETIDTNALLSRFDLDSIDAVVMGLKLEEESGISIHPETFMDGNASIEELSKRILQNHSPSV